MSVRDRLAAVDATVERLGRVTGRTLFGDRTGLTIFLGALALYMLYWRVDVFIVDTFVVADTLANLAAGHLHMETLVFSPDHGVVAGMHVVDGRLYGRNFGHAFLALPAVWALEGLSVLAEPRVLLAGGWSLVVLAFVAQLGRLAGRERVATLGGAAVATALFAANVAMATALPRWVLPLVALQVTSMVAGAFVGVVAYRLVGTWYGYRPAAFAGAAAVLLGPVGFWASVPKRHALTALLALVALFLFARSRTATGERSLRLRALAYVPVGLSAWVSAPEGLVLLLALAPVDLLTARSNDARALRAVGMALAVGLVPFLLTNLAISGDPLAPPRMLPNYTGAESIAGATAADAGGASVGGERGLSTASALSGVGAVLASLDAVLGLLSGQVLDGLAALAPSRLYHVYVRSGRIPGVDYSMTAGQTLELTLLESAPLLGALVAAPLAAVARRPWVGDDARQGAALRRRLGEPVVATDLFAASYVVLLSLVYLPKLPLHATITVRYLVPAVPFLLYAVVRLSVVREAIVECGDRFPSVTVLLGVGAVAFPVAVFGPADLAVGTVVQLTAVANLIIAGTVAVWAVLATVRGDRSSPATGALVLGLALGAMAGFLLLSGIEYFGHGREFALPVARAVEQLLPIR